MLVQEKPVSDQEFSMEKVSHCSICLNACCLSLFAPFYTVLVFLELKSYHGGPVQSLPNRCVLYWDGGGCLKVGRAQPYQL